MSNNWPSRVPLPGEHLPPCFQLIRPIVNSPHEEAVIEAGYPWVQTNSLIPTRMSLGANRHDKPIPNRLNLHSHHGENTHLIVEGDLTLKRANNYFEDTLYSYGNGPKELPVPPDEVYSGTTAQGCKFVEGHRCLSPRSAHRVINAKFLFLHHVEATFRSVQ